MRVRLNLATKPLESHRRFLLGASLSTIVAAIVFVALGWHVYLVRQAAAEDRARKEKISREYTKYQEERNDLKRYFEQKDIKGLSERAAFINGIIAVRSFNWTQMFMDLEHILPGGVRIISIEPKQVSGHVELNLTFGAADDEVKLKFLRALESSGQFSDVQIHSDAKVTPGATTGTDKSVVHLSTFYSGA
ncbi:MAG TPA: PilN domain-containing protein [Candidatus Acidoferrum sp.]